jgi:hypothetical protein
LSEDCEFAVTLSGGVTVPSQLVGGDPTTDVALMLLGGGSYGVLREGGVGLGISVHTAKFHVASLDKPDAVRRTAPRFLGTPSPGPQFFEQGCKDRSEVSLAAGVQHGELEPAGRSSAETSQNSQSPVAPRKQK